MSKQNEIMALATQELPTLNALVKINTAPGTDASTIALQELDYLQQQAIAKPIIYECVKSLPETVISGIKYVLKNNLSFDPNAGLVYIKSRNVEIGGQWKKALEVQPSADGLISIARQCGRILDVDRPRVLKDDKGKVVSVIARFLVPSFDVNRKPVAEWREREYDESDFSRWKNASHKENSKNKSDAATKDYSNPNYRSFNGGIDPEFARAKAIRHGLKKLGTNQNETRATQIITSAEKKVIVDNGADEAAMQDETGHDYINHEEVTALNNVAVTSYEEMQIPIL